MCSSHGCVYNKGVQFSWMIVLLYCMPCTKLTNCTLKQNNQNTNNDTNRACGFGQSDVLQATDLCLLPFRIIIKKHRRKVKKKIRGTFLYDQFPRSRNYLFCPAALKISQFHRKVNSGSCFKRFIKTIEPKKRIRFRITFCEHSPRMVFLKRKNKIQMISALTRFLSV